MSGACVKPAKQRLSLGAIARAYLREQPRCEPNDELQSFADEATLEVAVARACRAERPDGRRYHHQRRLPAAVLRAMAANLRAADVAPAASFDALHEVVRNRIGRIPGVGELTVYDTALRIGARLGLTPERVYLHSGTRIGARNLGLRWRERSLCMSDLPRSLQSLAAWQVEDLLCVFKDQLVREGARRPTPC